MRKKGGKGKKMEREWVRETVMLGILLELKLFELANRKCQCFYAALSFFSLF